MGDKTTKRDRFDWRLPFYAAIGALTLFVPIMFYGIDIVEMLYIFVAALIISLISLFVANSQEGTSESSRLVDVDRLFGYLMGVIQELS